MRHLRIVGEMSKALKRPGDEAVWPEPPEEFVHQLSDEISELRRPAPQGGGRFRLSFALVGAAALALPLAAFAEQAGDNLARRDDAVDVELVATDDDDGSGGGDDDSESSVAGAYDVGGDDTDSESSEGHGGYDVGGAGDDSGSDDGAAQAPAAPAAGGDDSDSDDGAAAEPAPLPAVPAAPAPEAPGGGGEDSEDSDD